MKSLHEVAELLTGLQAQHVVRAMERAGLTNPETIWGACSEMSLEELAGTIMAGRANSAELPGAVRKVLSWAVALKAKAWTEGQSEQAKNMASHLQLCETLKEVERPEPGLQAEATGPAAPFARDDLLKKGGEEPVGSLEKPGQAHQGGWGCIPSGEEVPSLLREGCPRTAQDRPKQERCRDNERAPVQVENATPMG